MAFGKRGWKEAFENGLGKKGFGYALVEDDENYTVKVKGYEDETEDDETEDDE